MRAMTLLHWKLVSHKTSVPFGPESTANPAPPFRIDPTRGKFVRGKGPGLPRLREDAAKNEQKSYLGEGTTKCLVQSAFWGHGCQVKVFSCRLSFCHGFADVGRDDVVLRRLQSHSSSCQVIVRKLAISR